MTTLETHSVLNFQRGTHESFSSMVIMIPATHSPSSKDYHRALDIGLS